MQPRREGGLAQHVWGQRLPVGRAVSAWRRTSTGRVRRNKSPNLVSTRSCGAPNLPPLLSFQILSSYFFSFGQSLYYYLWEIGLLAMYLSIPKGKVSGFKKLRLLPRALHRSFLTILSSFCPLPPPRPPRAWPPFHEFSKLIFPQDS